MISQWPTPFFSASAFALRLVTIVIVTEGFDARTKAVGSPG